MKHDYYALDSNNAFLNNNFSATFITHDDQRRYDDPLIDTFGNTRLMLAVSQARFDLMRLFIEKELVSINRQNFRGDTALLLACSNVYPSVKIQEQIVRYLILCGANIRLGNLDGNTPLHYAAGFGDEIIVNLLIQQGGFLNVQNENGETALYWAVKNGKSANVDILVKSGALKNIKTVNGNTAVDLAIGRNDKAILSSLFAGDSRKKNREKSDRMDMDNDSQENLMWRPGSCAVSNLRGERRMDDGRALSTASSALLWWM